jgi:hypothetical protein
MPKQTLCLSFVLVIAAFLGGAVANIGWAEKPRLATNIVRAEAFILTDSDGNVRAILSSAPDGAVELSLRDTTGKARGRLGLAASGEPYMELHDAEGQSRLWLGEQRSAGPGLQLRDRSGGRRAWLRLDSNDEPSLLLFDGKQNGRAVLGSVKLGEPGTPGRAQRSASSLMLLDEAGRLIFSAP